MRRKNGITLISLIVTVIIILILTGVSMSALFGNDDLFSKTEKSSQKYVKGEMVEAVDNAKIQLYMDNVTEGKEINISNLVEKIKQVSTINDRDHIIIVDDVEQTATIIDKKYRVVVDVTIDKDGNIKVESSIVDDVSEAMKPTIEYELEPKEGTYGEKVTIKITAREEKNGIAKIQFPDNTEKEYPTNPKEVKEEYEVYENDTYKFTAQGANGRKTSIYVTVKNTMSAGNIEIESLNTNPVNKPVSVKIRYDENVKMGGKLLTNADRFRYRIGTEEWQIADTAEITISVNKNGTIYASYYDGKEGYKTVTLEISNIDTKEPDAFELTAESTTNSITVKGSTQDKGIEGTAEGNIGVRGYQYKLTDSAGKVITDWTTETLETSHTFDTGISQGETYKVSMRAVDKAGNITEATNKEKEVTAGTVTTAEGNVTITASPTTPTKEVTVVITTSVEDYTLEYKRGSGEWTEYTQGSTGFKTTTNETISARFVDEIGQSGGTKSITLSNIDRAAPNAFNLSATSTSSSITVSGSTTDVGSTGTAKGNIGISGYQYKLSDSAGKVITNWTAKTTKTSYTFNTGISQGEKYKVSMRAVDKAGNIKEATNKEKEVTAGTVTTAEGNVTITASPTTPTKEVTVVITTSVEDYTLEYKRGSGEWTEYTQGSTGFKTTTNETISARFVDEIGQSGGTKSITLSNIDRAAPNAFNLSATSTSSSITVSGSTTDVGSTGTAKGNIGISGYQYKLSDSAGKVITNWTAKTTKTSYTFNTGISQGETYKVSMRAVDKAGNIKEATNKEKEIQTKAVPTAATITANEADITTKKATLTGTGTDKVSGIAKYEFYVDGALYKTVKTSATSTSIDLTFTKDSHVCYVRVYNNDNNYLDSDEISVAKHVHGASCYATVKGIYR